MTERLTEEQLSKIVGEVERLAEIRNQEIDREQMQTILTELNLPPDLLDEAMIQVQRRDALAVQQQRQRRIILGVAASLLLLVGGGALWWQQQQQIDARIVAKGDRVATVQNQSGTLTSVSRPAELIYTVTLQDAPVGKKLDLSCHWTALGDQILKQNHYQTKTITTPVWNTHCQAKIDTSAPTGTWRVKMFLGDRLLSDATFEVK